MSVIRKRLCIVGMTCVNCQNKIEHKLKNTAGIQEVTVSYNTGFADIAYDSDMITLKDIRTIIEKLDYEILPETGKERSDMGRIISLLVIIVSLYVLLQQFGILNLLVPSQLADTKMGYGMLFIVGLITSIHCIAMCGGINLSQCIPHGENGNENDNRLATFRPAILYNLGRVISYTAIGFLLGLVGMLIEGGSGTGVPILFQGVLKIIAGIFMVILGINMLGIFPWLRRFNLRMPKFLAVKIDTKKVNSRQPLMIGLLNGLMPCGPLQSMQIVALASGNPFAGALAMFLFSLGTVPLMLGFGSLVSAFGKKFSQKVMSVGAVLVVVLGLAMLSQGGSLSGLLLPDRLLGMIIMLCIIGVVASIRFNRRLYKAVSIITVMVIIVTGGIALNRLNENVSLNEATAAAGEIEIVDGVQVINSTLNSGRYPNITVQAGIPVKWVIDAPSGSINGCNYKMLLKEYGIEHEFTEGENIIEFTPVKSGTVQYTCWMGMIRGNIFVTDENETEAASSSDQPTDVPVPSGYHIPSDQLAVAQLSKNENGEDIQEVSIDLTENGFSPAVIVVKSDIAVTWNINNTLADDEKEMQLLAPAYSTILELTAGENILYLYPQDSFEVSTGDNRFYAYIKVVDDVNEIDEVAIRQEVDAFETLIYPDVVFESSGMGCCGGY
ncbi:MULTISPECIES: urease accessory protein UreH domain-containing protein [Lachnospiraceae]|uniref:urease accessory protein UreH domain-containing protein n=1 Tax=Lachnospiraceae TaxID=186803 RepID=UPI0034A0DB43